MSFGPLLRSSSQMSCCRASSRRQEYITRAPKLKPTNVTEKGEADDEYTHTMNRPV